MDLFRSHAEPDDTRLSMRGGRFRTRGLEATYQTERLPDHRHHARLLFVVTAIINTAFLPIDWRFTGTPQFWIAIPARCGVIACALAALLVVRRDVGEAALTTTLAAWMAGTALGVAFLVTSHSALAQFVVIVLPLAYYLAVPLPFRWTVAGGACCSVMLLAGYFWTIPITRMEVGMILATVTLHVALTMATARAHRHARGAWASARAARRLGDALAVSRNALQGMFLASPIPLVLTRADESGRVEALSRSAAALLQTDRPATLREFYAAPDADDPLPHALARDGGTTEMEVSATLNDVPRTLLLKATTIALPGGSAILTGILDMTERKAAQVNLEHIASTDSLTGLRNRLSFFAAARAEMTRASRTRGALTLLMIDVDHFKAVNDTHGHGAGDAVLRAFAGVCRDVLGPDAIVGRLGGEEFGVLLPESRNCARNRAERLREAVASLRTKTPHASIAVTVSIGVAPLLPGERDLDHALGRADFALYAGKRAGRNRVMTDEDTGWTQAIA